MELTKIDVQDLVQKANEKFIHSEEVFKMLGYAYNGTLDGESNLNVILYGPPGHGKTDMIAFFTDYIKEHSGAESWFGSASNEMSEENLYGAFNLEEYKQGRYNYNLERDGGGFTQYDVAVIDEILDGKSTVLSSLKTVINDKAITMGGQKIPIKTKFFIGATNKIPENVVNDETATNRDSVQALFDRFLQRMEVVWPSYTHSDYGALASLLRLDEKYSEDMIKEIIVITEAISSTSTTVSPRNFIKTLAYIHQSYGKEGLNLLNTQEGYRDWKVADPDMNDVSLVMLEHEIKEKEMYERVETQILETMSMYKTDIAQYEKDFLLGKYSDADYLQILEIALQVLDELPNYEKIELFKAELEVYIDDKIHNFLTHKTNHGLF